MDKAMINPATGWNTWNYESLTALSYVDGDRVEIEVRVSVFDEIGLEHITDVRWKDLVSLGPHAFDGSYMAVEFEAGFEACFRLEAAADERRLALRVMPTRPSAKRVVLEFLRPGHSLALDRQEDLWRLGGWTARVEGTLPPRTFYVRTTGPAAVGGRGERLAALVAPEEDTAGLEADIGALLEQAAARHRSGSLRGGGALGGAPEAMLRAAAWNTVYDMTGRGVCTTASRDWCKDWQGVVLFGWDTYFNGLIAGMESPAHAWANFAASLAGAAPEGFVPNWHISNGVLTADRSQPPVGAFCAWRTHLRHPDPEQLRRLYPGLKRWHDWWMGARSTPDGLLAWGSDPRAAYAYPQLRQAMFGAQICACYESGLDNSPMFDSVPYDPTTGRMLQADVGLTALYTVDAECLARIAEVVGETADAAALDTEVEMMRSRINARLWCEEEGIYLNRRFDGAFNPRRSPTSFYPLLCGVPTPEMAERMVREHLRNPAEFWGDYPLPSIARSDPAYRDNNYWRGRIWAPMTYLVVAGLRRYGLADLAGEVAMRSLRMFRANWERHGAVYENYNAETGDGGDVANADPLYVWGGLLACAALEELTDATEEGLVFGSPRGEAMEARSLLLRGHRYDAAQGQEGLRVDRDGQPLLRASAPCRVTLRESDDRPALVIIAPGAATVEAGGFAPGGAVPILVNGAAREVTADARGWVRTQA